MKPSSPFSPAEEDALASEIADDLAAGVGEKHFAEIFDEVSSTQGSARTDMDPGVRERLARFAIEFAAGLSDRLRGNEHGFVCLGVNPDGHGQGFVCKFRDKGGRPFTAECSFEDGFEAAAQFGQQNMGRAMLQKVIERLIAARVRYFERMNGLH